jgi:predicted  nucleic acid-binding Zn-ribbon protein
MRLFKRLAALERRVSDIEGEQMAEQENVAALETAVAQVATDLATAKGTLQTELNELQAKINEGQPVDLTKLTEAVNGLDPAVQALTALKPE